MQSNKCAAACEPPKLFCQLIQFTLESFYHHLWSYGAVYSITTFIRAITSLLQIRQVARLRSTTCNLQGLSPMRRSTQTTPSRNLTLGVMQSLRSRNSSPAREYLPSLGFPPRPGCPSSSTLVAASSLLSDFRLDPSVLPAPPCLGGSAAVPAIPLVPVASSWTGTSTHAAQTQAGTTRAGTQRHVGLAERACTETSMHAAQTQARTQHKPP